MDNMEMTREKAILEIYRTSNKYGLTTCEQWRSDIPGIQHEKDGYINITINEIDVPGSYDADHQTIKKRLVVSGNVCHMNPNSDVDELLRAANEIQQGALFILAMQRLDIIWTQAI